MDANLIALILGLPILGFFATLGGIGIYNTRKLVPYWENLQ